MGYDIRAWLDRSGTPRLQIVDSDTGYTRVARALTARPSRELKSLFRVLMLLSLRENLAQRAKIGDEQ